jgi:putative membrane protein
MDDNRWRNTDCETGAELECGVFLSRRTESSDPRFTKSPNDETFPPKNNRNRRIDLMIQAFTAHHPILANIPLESSGLWHALIGTASFGLLGLVLMLVGFKAFELITLRLDIEKQLEERNMAVGIVVAALLLGLSLIVVVSIL